LVLHFTSRQSTDSAGSVLAADNAVGRAHRITSRGPTSDFRQAVARTWFLRPSKLIWPPS